jgi:hypothetical protein
VEGRQEQESRRPDSNRQPKAAEACLVGECQDTAECRQQIERHENDRLTGMRVEAELKVG